MKPINYILFILFLSLSFYKSFGVDGMTTSGVKIEANTDMTIFFQLVDINMQQKRRTYFGVNDFSMEEKVADIWSLQIKEFIKSNCITDIKFMSIEIGEGSAYSFIVSYKSIYKLFFKLNTDDGIFNLESQKNVSLSNNKVIQEINNLQKSYFTIDSELWSNRLNLTKVFSMFADMSLGNTQMKEFSLKDFYKFGKNHKYLGAYTIRYPNKELDVFLRNLEEYFK